jgi:sigma-B regulation protein RsbU (phosphoserine phosphatase)
LQRIQKNLLPKAIPGLGNFEIEAKSISSRQIGGDYYDIIKLDECHYAVAIADVSGKGVPAALLMANLQAFLKSVCKRLLPIEEATGILNDLVSENTSDGRFITFFWCYLDLEKNTLMYVNAGHNPPMLLRDGKITYLDKGGMILGVMKTVIPYESGEIALQKNDALFLYTDGVSEAKNDEDQEYSEERLERYIKSVPDLPAGDLVNGILEDVHSFVREFNQSDDITLVVLKHV